MKGVRLALLTFLLLASSLTLAFPALADDTLNYTVRPGDTLSHIAFTYSTTTRTLIKLNKAKYPCLATRPACLRSGWVIVVPKPPPGTVIATPRPASPTPIAASPAQIAPAPTVSPTAGIESAIADLTNQQRTANGLSPLTRNDPLDSIARWKSQDMVLRDYFGHNDPTTGRFLTGDLVFGSALGTWAGENLAWFNTAYEAGTVAESAVQSWMNSPGHRENILRPEYTLIGAGVVQYSGGWMVTQTFAGP